MAHASLIDRDLKHVWHPCSQMKDYETFQPLIVKSANGSYLELDNGKKVIDAISSWWCKSLGHGHPRLKNALIKQADRFEHVILANTTNDVITLLSEKLANLTTTLTKVFYAGDGSSAVEIAMKMSLHARQIQGDVKKTKFIALANGYHGETTGALSVSDIGLYKTPYHAMLFDVAFITAPYVANQQTFEWEDCSEHWQKIQRDLEQHIETTTAIILEPIIQGAGGMKLYSKDFLKRLRQWTQENNIHLIADEIMTGIGRTGKMLACQHANIEPDFLCLAKGLTAGWMPFSAVLTREDIYQTFYADYKSGKSFLHSHTYSGHALAASIALEVLAVVEEMQLCKRADELGNIMTNAMQDIAKTTGKINNIRNVGAIVAADLICDEPDRRLGFEIYQKAVALGALLRPLGNTIYWLPPLTTKTETLMDLADITQKAISAIHF